MNQEKGKMKTRQIAILGMLIAVMLVLAYTPLGYLHLSFFGLEVTMNMIPVALAAITLGPIGGLIIGGVFGVTSFLQCIGVGGVSEFGATLFNINPFLTFVECMVPRILDGWLTGYVYKAMRKLANAQAACFVTGFASAFLNTIFFMTGLVVMFGQTDYIQNMMGGMNVILFCCYFVGINAIFEWIVATVLTGFVGMALSKARLLWTPPEK